MIFEWYILYILYKLNIIKYLFEYRYYDNFCNQFLRSIVSSYDRITKQTNDRNMLYYRFLFIYIVRKLYYNI